MSTRSYIAKKLPNGKYKGVYHHSDGYPSWLGLLLWNYYNNEEQLDRLIALGDLSFAGPIPEDDPRLWEPGKIDPMTFRYIEKYESDKCRTYKGRGETEGVGPHEEKLSWFLSEDFAYIWECDHFDVYNWGEHIGTLHDVLEREGLI